MRNSAPSLLSNALIAWFVSAYSTGCGGLLSAPTPVEADATVPQQSPWFEDATAAQGLDFVNDPGPVDGKYFMPQINGTGAALLDFDKDGRLDIYLLQFGGADSQSTNALFRQLPSGKFQNVSKGSGLDIGGLNRGLAVGDVNNDGWVDLVVTQYRGIKFFLNQGKGVFRDATQQAGLENPYWGSSASFLDFDRDGWLDLVVVNYLEYDESRVCLGRGGKRDYCLPNIFQGTPTLLWRNLGVDSEGKWIGFENRTDASGLGSKTGPGMGVLCADFTGDGWPDIFVANDIQANHLWVNQKNGTFTEEGVARGLAFDDRGGAASNMGVAYGDVDGDGLSDLFITHFTNEHHGLWMQQSRGSFEEQSIRAGLTQTRWHGTAWGTTLADFDHDGALDLVLVNGFVQRIDAPSHSFWDDYKDRNQLFVNDGAGHFRDISQENPALCGEANIGRGLCVGDLDGDGALDLLITSVAGAARILRNVAPARGHWLLIRAVDPALHRDAIGAEIRLQAGARHWEGLIQPSQSYQCVNDMRAHFGLGSTEKIDRVEILWPDGSTEQFNCPGVDRIWEVQRGQGMPVQFQKGEGK